MLYIIRPPASASESIKRLLVMNCCIRACERLVDGRDGCVGSVVGCSDKLASPPHSGRKTGREVTRYPNADQEYFSMKSSSML